MSARHRHPHRGEDDEARLAEGDRAASSGVLSDGDVAGEVVEPLSPESAAGGSAADESSEGLGLEEDPAEAVERLRAELELERGRADDNWDRYLRAEADLENLRKRNARLREEAVERKRRELLGRFLDVADNLARALSHAGSDRESLASGVEGIYRELQRILSVEGVEEMDAMDAPFDPAIHEAVAIVPVPGTGAERVVSVERAGYTVNSELLRAARVVVGRPADADTTEREPSPVDGGAA